MSKASNQEKLSLREGAESERLEIERVSAAAFATLRALYRPGPRAIAARTKLRPKPARIVAIRDGQIIGTAGYRLLDRALSIIGLGVLPEHRRQGVASAMLDHLGRLALQCGADRLTLHVIAQTGNVALFEGFGFKVVNSRPAGDFLSDVFDSLTEVRMEKPL
ncbi:MAG: GNAT family N-acetyltransferase [Planctomycetota bacterium]|jgi:ribosomal protein S18 acetylase RimI-like enzyme